MDATRIASLLYPALEPRLADAEQDWNQVDALRMLLRRHLPPVTASLFARARPVAGQSGGVEQSGSIDHVERIEWYSNLAGEPVPLGDLTDDERARIVALVEDRLNSVRHLAARLESAADTDPPADGPKVDLLRRAARYPHPNCIYVVAGEPVLTYWGLDAKGSGRRGAGPVAHLPPTPSAWQRLRPVLLGTAAVGLVLALALGAWHWRQQHLQDTLTAELAASLAAECKSTAILQALHARLERIDPEGERFPEIRLDTERELHRCADAADLEARLAQAREDCSALTPLADALAYHDAAEAPFAGLLYALNALQADCTLADEISVRLAALGSDCSGITALAQEYPARPDAGYPLAEPIAAVASEAAACQIAADLSPRIVQAGGDCGALRALDRELGQRIAASAAALAGSVPATDGAPTPGAGLDPARGPLAALHGELDGELERCALADNLTARLAEAQGDCVELASLREQVSRQGNAEPPFDGLALRLDTAIGQCAALNDLELRFVRAQGDCAAVAALEGELEGWRDNLRFADIRARIGVEATMCARASAWEQQIADAGMNCDALRALAGESGERVGSHFETARQALKAKLARCDILARFASRLDGAGSHCGQLKAVQRDLRDESGGDLAPIRQRLAKALEPCQPKSVAANPPRGAGAYAMSGNCNGNLVISPAGGYHGDRVRHIVSIEPPANARIGKVVSDNRGCRNCRLNKRNATTWSVQLYYGCSGRGTVPIAYSAYDRGGKLVCSGRGVARCLGRRR
ncbi:MAG: hypothetical protein V2I24_08720 [Halieaceae bacterium]|jgi:hypothetical protein|nr:hypothetical protein [Halieaceae bacterium]